MGWPIVVCLVLIALMYFDDIFENILIHKQRMAEIRSRNWQHQYYEDQNRDQRGP